MDAEPDEPNLPLKWQLRIYLLTKMPGDPRRKIKKLIAEADKFKNTGYLNEALSLYRAASLMAKDLKIHYLQKVLIKRMIKLELIPEIISHKDHDPTEHLCTLDEVIANLTEHEIPKSNI